MPGVLIDWNGESISCVNTMPTSVTQGRQMGFADGSQVCKCHVFTI